MKNTLLNWHKNAIGETQKAFSIANVMQAPKLEKIVINVGLKEAVTNSKAIPTAVELLSSIAGQKPVITRARKSIAGFKIREGMAIGACVTLRGIKMYNFLYKLINLALPKIRDFQGLKKKMDGQGNYNLGLSSVELFPEGERSGVVESHLGLCITIVTSTDKDEEAYVLLKNLGMPFIR
jgi:large subunit ribosomal protein L5